MTEFSVVPKDGGQRTLARISSVWEAAGGLRGLADRLGTPLLMGRIFAKQLRQLDQYVRSTGDRLPSDRERGRGE